MIGKEIRSSELKTTTGIQQTRKDSEPILPSITGGFFDYDNEVRNSSPSNPETATASTPKEPIITTSNLYKHAPTIVFIKEKYKNYLEWLASNYAANNAPDQTQPKSSSSPTTSHHLAWYDFEQSLSRKQKSDNSHVRSVGSTATAAEKDEMLRYSLEHLDSSMASQNHKLLAAVLNSLRNSKEFNATAEKQRRLGLKLDLDAVRRPQMGEAQKKSTKKQMPPPPLPRKLDPLGSRESPSNNTTSNQRQGVTNTQMKPQQQQNISNQRQAQIPVNPSPSRVQFMTEHHDPKYPLTNLTTTTTTTSSSTTGNYYQYQTSVNSTPPILKPILKHAQSSMAVNPGVSSCSKRSSNAGGDYLQLVYLKRSQRKSSSTGSSSSNDDQASQSGASTSSSSSSSYGDAAAFASLPNSKPLLPPILPLAARCSDDFYAVLNDMEKSKYV